MFAFTILCIIFLLSVVQASPLIRREVFDPTILSPNASTVWPVGTTQFVTWETDNIPPDSQLTDPTGMVVLGHLGPTGGLNLNLTNPLAQGFPLHQGSVQITVPDVPPRTDYIVVLFGDSGNSSPSFAITQITSGGGGSSSTSSSTKSSSHSSEASTGTTSTTAPGGTVTTPIGVSTTSLADTASVSAPVSTPTSPSTSSSSSSSSSSALSPASTTSTNSAWPRYHSNWMKTLSSIGVASFVLTFVV